MDSIYDQYWLVTVPIIIICGIVGTGLMTLFMYLMTLLTGKEMKLTKIFGSVLTMTTRSKNKVKDAPYARVVGNFVQYIVGVLFMAIFFLLWKYGSGGPDFFTGILLSIGSGLVTIGLWRIFLTYYPQSPDISLKPYLATLFIAHFVFVAGCIITFNFLVSIQDYPTM